MYSWIYLDKGEKARQRPKSYLPYYIILVTILKITFFGIFIFCIFTSKIKKKIFFSKLKQNSFVYIVYNLRRVHTYSKTNICNIGMRFQCGLGYQIFNKQPQHEFVQFFFISKTFQNWKHPIREFLIKFWTVFFFFIPVAIIYLDILHILFPLL